MNLGNRYSQHSFAKVPQVDSARSSFDRSFAAKDTMNFDYLTPCFVDEILPGDTINLNVKSFIRLAPQVRPLMDNMYLDFFFFFVPNRLVWNNWEKFNGAQDNPGDSTNFIIPRITYPNAGYDVGSIFDKFGIPTNVANVVPSTYHDISALPFRAYNLIWNEWFRDQNLQNSVTVPKGDGPDNHTTYSLLKRAKKHDYFTSALPWPQKGPAVGLPIGGTAPVYGNSTPIVVAQHELVGAPLRQLGMITTNNSITYAGAPDGDSSIYWPTKAQASGTSLEADLTDATLTSINVFRQAMMMQSFLELDARGGTRYTEIIKAHFNVTNPDFRLQRPEFLSGGTVHIAQHPVAQTSESDTTPQGNLAAFSTASELSNRIGFSKSFTEHGYVIGLIQARGDVTYQQGLNRLWSRRTREDFFWPKFQELGEQPVYMREIYFRADQLLDDDILGYQERHSDYRYRPSEIRGQFRSTYAQSLDVWHLAEEFGSAPALNSTFIQSNTPIERALVVPDPSYPDLLCDYFFDYKHARRMVTYAIPASLGRF